MLLKYSPVKKNSSHNSQQELVHFSVPVYYKMSNNFDKHDILKDVNTGDVISIDGFEREKFKIGKIIEGGMGFVFELIPERAHTHNLALNGC